MSDLLLASADTIRKKHENDSARKLVAPLPGTVLSTEVWQSGSYYEKKRIYGFNSDRKVVIVVELHDDRPEIGPILVASRESQPWHWFMKDGWFPVGTYPATTEDYKPPKSSSRFQNGDGKTSNPNAWAKTKSNGNKIFVWDVSWEGDVGDIGSTVASTGLDQDLLSPAVEGKIKEVERLLLDLTEPDPNTLRDDAFD